MASDDVTVRFEPCDTFLASPDPAAAACSKCGWFEEDHWFAELDRPVVKMMEVALTGRA